MIILPYSFIEDSYNTGVIELIGGVYSPVEPRCCNNNSALVAS